ncbi:hypothetical protein I4U23_029919 [Adineta vaga]|nr:hypothetical protein I4U23_029919 [Adineta vaga]
MKYIRKTKEKNTLEAEQKNLIVNNKGGEHPLYLAYLCENLRQFGDYSLITKRLKGYPQTTEELIDVLLDEVSVTIGNQPVLDAVDMVTMLERYMNNNVDETKRVNVDRMMWSTIRRHLKSFLDTSWIDGHQLITFRHSTLLQKLHKRYFEDKNDELRSIHKFLAEFFLKDPSIKDYSRRRVPYHYEQAHMIKELIAYLRSLESRSVAQIDRQAYLRKYRCKRHLTDLDSIASQRAYVCNVCATLFKLGPYTMTKGSCLICTTPIFGFSSSQYSPTKRDARLCTQHGQPGYPRTIRCVTCKSIRPNLSGTLPTVMDSIPMNICLQCSMSGGAGTRCCDFEIDEIKS